MILTTSIVINDAELVRTIRNGARPVVREIAFSIDGEIKLLMTTEKHGREYKRGSRTHVASASGEAPAVDTGFLINSIQTDIKSDTEATITIDAEYAETLEFHKDRPFVRPAIDSVLKRFDDGGFLSEGLG
jgi:hypothetical protein